MGGKGKFLKEVDVVFWCVECGFGIVKMEKLYCCFYSSIHSDFSPIYFLWNTLLSNLEKISMVLSRDFALDL